jgi:phosphatidylserine/phosphatidylglycerophosphate/cardiolipin synthase-like enzyme
MADEPEDVGIDPSPPPPAHQPARRWGRRVFHVFIAAWILVGAWNVFKPLPEGTRVRGEIVDTPLADVRFLADVTTADAFGAPVVRQQIFDSMFKLIGEAREYLVLDFFLFNSQRGSLGDAKPQRALSAELRDALLARKRAVPDLKVVVIADPVNDVYGGLPSKDLKALTDAGIDVVRLDLDRLRDPNPVYSGFWRLTMKWWSGDGSGDPFLPNPLDDGPDRVSFGAWARLLNFKADHRKVIIGDDGKGGMTGIVASANPHDASSLNSNVGVRVSGPALAPLLASELALARGSGWTDPWVPPEPLAVTPPSPEAAARVQVLTEGEIRAAVVRNFAAAGVGDSIDIAMFYLSERDVIQALLGAARRGAAVRVILDPNKDAFGREKNGIPNRSVAAELSAASDGAIKVRWFRTHGEQFHTKLVVVRTAQEYWFTAGSANLTRRNIGDYNLEANVAINLPPGSDLAASIGAWFDQLWSNRGPPDLEYTTDIGTYADPSQGTYWLYRFMEGTGLSSF